MSDRSSKEDSRIAPPLDWKLIIVTFALALSLILVLYVTLCARVHLG